MGLVSKNCIDLVKSFEGFSPTVYLDEVGVRTLGYGMTGDEIKGLTSVTEPQACQMLENLINSNYAAPLGNDLNSKKIVLNQNQFDALSSMAYNIGVEGLLGSTLYRNICQGVRDANTITTDFLMWRYAGSKVYEGLVRRRTAEAQMFLTPSGQVVDTTASSGLDNGSLTIQKVMNRLQMRDGKGNALVEDGIMGTCTREAIKRFQSICNFEIDGIAGDWTWGAINYITEKHLLSVGNSGSAVRYVQFRVGTEYDGIFGANTKEAVCQWQAHHNCSPDGIVGNKTLDTMIG